MQSFVVYEAILEHFRQTRKILHVIFHKKRQKLQKRELEGFRKRQKQANTRPEQHQFRTKVACNPKFRRNWFINSSPGSDFWVT